MDTTLLTSIIVEECASLRNHSVDICRVVPSTDTCAVVGQPPVVWNRQVARFRCSVGGIVPSREKDGELVIVYHVDSLNKESHDSKPKGITILEGVHHVEFRPVPLIVQCVLRVGVDVKLNELKDSTDTWNLHSSRFAHGGIWCFCLFAVIDDGVPEVVIRAGTRL